MTPAVPKLRPKELLHFDDLLHGILPELGDFVWPPWRLRCVEFHFGRGHFKKADCFGWHTHQELQLELVVSGSFRFTIKGHAPVIVGEGEVLAVPPRQLHRWECLESGLMIGISLADLPSSEPDGKNLDQLLEPTVRHPRTLDLQVAALIRELAAKNKEREIFRHQRLRAWVFLIISQILNQILPGLPEQSGPAGEGAPPSRSRRVVSKIVRFVDANIEGDLSMARFEESLGLSSRHIHRIFVEVTGMSCQKYVANRRLEIARSMLQEDPNLSIKQIAYATGFASPAHFSSSFRKAFGVTPSKYSPSRGFRIRR